MTTAKSNRKLYLDLLRILAVFLVLYNHTSGFHYYLYYPGSPPVMIVSILLSSFTTINVPLFLMISGALLLGKEESYTTLFRKRILRFCVVLFLASLIIFYLRNKASFDFTAFVPALISGSIDVTYWFIYAYLGFLLMLPLLRKMAIHLTHREILLILGCRIVLFSAPRIAGYLFSCFNLEFVAISDSFSFPFSSIDVLLYPILGYYFGNKFPSEKLGKREILYLVGLVAANTVISTILTYHQGIHNEYTTAYLAVFTYLSTISVFLIAKVVCGWVFPEQSNSRTERIITAVSSLTFGIYLADPVFNHLAYDTIHNLIGNVIHPIPFSFIYCIISMICCGTVIYLLKKLPFFRNIL